MSALASTARNGRSFLTESETETYTILQWHFFHENDVHFPHLWHCSRHEIFRTTKMNNNLANMCSCWMRMKAVQWYDKAQSVEARQEKQRNEKHMSISSYAHCCLEAEALMHSHACSLYDNVRLTAFVSNFSPGTCACGRAADALSLRRASDAAIRGYLAITMLSC